MCERSNKGGVKGEGIVAERVFCAQPLRGFAKTALVFLLPPLRFGRNTPIGKGDYL